MRDASLTSLVLVGSALVLGGCRAPTQLTVEVTTDVPCKINGAAITAGLLGDALENNPPATASVSCDANGRVGALVIVPSGPSDGNIAIKVVAGVDSPYESCKAPAYEGCIVARRALRFIPHEDLR